MPRLAAFWQEFWDSIKWVGDAPEKLKKVVTYILVLLALLGVSAEQAGWIDWFRPWASYLVLLVAVWLTWKIATAWERTRGPVIREGELEPDQDHKMFDMRVRNSGGGEVTAHVYATELADSRRITEEIEIHWRGIAGETPMCLSGLRSGTAGVLQVLSQNGNHCICLAVRGKGREFTIVPLCDPAPLAQQRELRLTLRIAFKREGVLLIDKPKTVIITPTPSSPLHYTVRSIR